MIHDIAKKIIELSEVLEDTSPEELLECLVGVVVSEEEVGNILFAIQKIK